MKLSLVLVTLVFSLTGCLKTRNEVRDSEQRQVMQQQVVTLQKTNADAGSRFGDLEEQFRHLNGRVEVMENQLGRSQAGVESAIRNNQSQSQEVGQKVVVLQEALTKMERDILTLNAEIQALKADRGAAQAAKASQDAQKSSKKDTVAIAQEAFDKKEWKQAILNYQKYRDEQPKGGKFADATYKIGVSFQELGMRDEAKTFYDEVIGKFPKSDEARRSRIRLKGLKK